MEAQLALPLDDGGEPWASPTTPAERETTIRRAEDEEVWTLWSDDPAVMSAMRRLAGRPRVTVREEDGAVRAAFPAKALKIRGLPRPTKPCPLKPPPNGLKLYERETIFRRGCRGKSWEVCTTSPRVQEALLRLVDGERVTVARSERRGEELVFTLPAAAVRIVPPTAALLESIQKARAAVPPEVAAANLSASRKRRGEESA